MISSIFEEALLSIDRNAAVVTDMFVTAGGHIEKGCLSAVRIAYKGNSDFLSSLCGESCHLPFNVFIIGFKRRQCLTLRQELLCLALTDDFDVRSFSTAQGNLVSDDLIFNGVPQRSIKDNLDLIASDKAHFPDSSSETSVTRDLYDHATLTCT